MPYEICKMKKSIGQTRRTRYHAPEPQIEHPEAAKPLSSTFKFWDVELASQRAAHTNRRKWRAEKRSGLHRKKPKPYCKRAYHNLAKGWQLFVKILAHFVSFLAVSAPNFAIEHAFCSICWDLQHCLSEISKLLEVLSLRIISTPLRPMRQTNCRRWSSMKRWWRSCCWCMIGGMGGSTYDSRLEDG